MLWASKCAVCGIPGVALCGRCWSDLVPAEAEPPPPGLDRCVAALDYDGPGAVVVAGIKYRNERALLGWAAEAIVSAVGLELGLQVVTWAPTTARRRRERGFDQAELLARRVARLSRLPARRLLRRGPGSHQTGRSRHDRLSGPRFDPVGPGWSSVLIVDDVWTTGATLTSAATALREGGASVVVGGVLARARARWRSAPTTDLD